jgi:hypothetical protein
MSSSFADTVVCHFSLVTRYVEVYVALSYTMPCYQIHTHTHTHTADTNSCRWLTSAVIIELHRSLIRNYRVPVRRSVPSVETEKEIRALLIVEEVPVAAI